MVQDHQLTLILGQLYPRLPSLLLTKAAHSWWMLQDLLRLLNLPQDLKKDYDTAKGLFYELQKKYYPQVTRKTPFSTTAARKIGFENPDSYFTPGPDHSNLQKQLVERNKKNNTFGSRKPRFTDNIDKVKATCASYSIEEAFNTINKPKSHLKSKKAAFLSTSKKSDFFDLSSSPAPGTYDPPDLTLKVQGCVFPRDLHKDIIKITPGPAD